MNIFTRFYNWLFGIQPKPATPGQKIRNAMQRALNFVKSNDHLDKNYHYQGKSYNDHTAPMNQNSVNERLEENWQNRMDSQEKKMSRGAQNIFSIIKGRCNWGNKNLWRRCDKQKPSHTKYGKPHRGHDN